VYKNAIQGELTLNLSSSHTHNRLVMKIAIPKDLDFRLQFLDLYTQFHVPSDSAAIQEIYDSIAQDFSTPLSKSILSKRFIQHFKADNYSSSEFPLALKQSVEAFEKHCQDSACSEMTQLYAEFLQDLLQSVKETHLVLLFQCSNFDLHFTKLKFCNR
jgi:hypothetical protein